MYVPNDKARERVIVGVVHRRRGGPPLRPPRSPAKLFPVSETVLDVKGMACPLPVLRANRALRGLAPGERLRVLATDRAAIADFRAFCREAGHALLAFSEDGGTLSFLIRRGEDRP